MRQGILLLLAALCAGCAGLSPREYEAQRYQRYAPYLGEPIAHFNYFTLDGWEVVGPYQVVLKINPRTAYLLTLDKPCPNLEWSQAMGLTRTAGWVHAKFDSVVIRDAQCRIAQIRPIDQKRLREDEAKSKA